MNRINNTYQHLVIINVLVFIAANFFITSLYDTWALYGFGNEKFKIYQFLTHMFMHAKFNEDWMHIVFNMVGLYTFGRNLEYFWGGKRFLFFYIACGLGAGLINNMVNYYCFHDFYSSAVGASGAIYGLLVASAMMFPDSEIYLYFAIPVKSKYLVPGLILMDLFSGVTGFSIFGDGIAHFAHIGGALVGFIIMMAWKKNRH